ncbi:MAG: glycogen/starch/alpha-glucan phosphorylase [Granulosicoccus sp.]
MTKHTSGLGPEMTTPDKNEAVAARELITQDASWVDAKQPLGLDVEALKASVARHFSHTLGRDPLQASAHYLFTAVAMAVRDRLMDSWRATKASHEASDTRRTCYLSLEFLMGRALTNAVHNLGLTDDLGKALCELGIALEDIEQLELDAGLGNGGLGRLAACFLDSCASLGLPVTGYGLRYRYGMFRQVIDNGWQLEQPDNWLRNGHVWELERPELTCRIHFGGFVRLETTASGQIHHHWDGVDDVFAVPYDVPVPGHSNGVVNTLRLWSAAATDEFRLHDFNAGGYTESVAAKNAAENITMVLYPNDSSENGKVLRLRQQYFLVSASLQDTIRQWLGKHDDFTGFSDAHCFQLNDTHPALAVAELMRLLLDVHRLGWFSAWKITSRVMAYTNHTLLPEALECWSLGMMVSLLPRPVEIIHEINRRFLDTVNERWPNDVERQAVMSIVSFDQLPVVRMAHLAIVGSFSVNGVAELHSNLLRQGLFRSFNELWPERFNNKTNGVTQRRWLAQSNPGLRLLLDDTIGPGWLKDTALLENLLPHVDNQQLQIRWREIKNDNKRQLASLIESRTGLLVNPDHLFDVQVKRMHEYKRQLLCVLHVVHAWQEIIAGREASQAPRVVLIAGKAAPGYAQAKAIIKLLNNVALVINNDARVADRLKLVFLPDYNVSAMEIICPAADLSEQISTAGKEASGTGNMKLMMNGALTIGTLDGANVEILQAVGEKNFFRFGLDVDGVDKLRSYYQPSEILGSDERVQAIFNAFDSGLFDGQEAELIRSVIETVRNPHDPWMTMADLPAYLDAQAAVSTNWFDKTSWTRKSMINTAMSGRFSSDRTITDYNNDIWRLTPLNPVGRVVR